MVGFSFAVSFEMGEAAVGGAVGVSHDHNTFGLVQAERHADLFEDEVLFEVVARRSEGLGSSGDDDHVGAFDTLLLQELPHGRADTVIEAAEDSGVGDVLVGRRVEMEDLAHGRYSFRFYLFRRVALVAGLRPGWADECVRPYVSLARLRALSSTRSTAARCGLPFPGRRGGLLRRRPGVGLWLRRWLLRGPPFSSCGRRWRTWYSRSYRTGRQWSGWRRGRGGAARSADRLWRWLRPISGRDCAKPISDSRPGLSDLRAVARSWSSDRDSFRRAAERHGRGRRAFCRRRARPCASTPGFCRRSRVSSFRADAGLRWRWQPAFLPAGAGCACRG